MLAARIVDGPRHEPRAARIIATDAQPAQEPLHLVRNITFCRPGAVGPIVDKVLAMAELSLRVGVPRMRIMTDFSAEESWTVVAEMEIPNFQAFERMMRDPPGSPDVMKHFEVIMTGYRDIVACCKPAPPPQEDQAAPTDQRFDFASSDPTVSSNRAAENGLSSRCSPGARTPSRRIASPA